jgi:DNA-binding LacI/PurR family transcriptional regulator
LDSAGLSYEPEVVVTAPDFSIEAGYKSAAQLFLRNDPPGAIYAASDQLAIGAFQAIKDRGLSIPKDVAVVGYNDIEMAPFVDPPLTTATAPAYQMGSEAMRLLGRIVDGGIPNEISIKLDTELMIRQSCGCNQIIGQ